MPQASMNADANASPEPMSQPNASRSLASRHGRRGRGAASLHRSADADADQEPGAAGPGRGRRVSDAACTAARITASRSSSASIAQYTPGDDPRYLDWRLFARTDRYYVKRFEDETNLRCYLLVDHEPLDGLRLAATTPRATTPARWRRRWPISCSRSATPSACSRSTSRSPNTCRRGIGPAICTG